MRPLAVFVLAISFVSAFGIQHTTTLDSLTVKIDSLESAVNNLIETIQSQDDNITHLESLLEKQQDELSRQKDDLKRQKGYVDTSFSGVSEQIGAASYFIGGFGIVMVIVSIGLGVYVNKMERSVRSISDDAEVLLQRNITVRKEVEDLGNKITSDTAGLYKIVRNEESDYMLERLINVPEDINNLFQNLASRELEDYHFEKLKEAALQVIGNDDRLEEAYILLFFQHFAGQTIINTQLKPILIKDFHMIFEGAFKNDMIISSFDLFKAFVKLGLKESKNDINAFVSALSNSGHSELEEVYSSIFQAVQPRDNQFLLYNQIDKTDQTKKFRSRYGKLILEYKSEELIEEEQNVVAEIENLSQQS